MDSTARGQVHKYTPADLSCVLLFRGVVFLLTQSMQLLKYLLRASSPNSPKILIKKMEFDFLWCYKEHTKKEQEYLIFAMFHSPSNEDQPGVKVGSGSELNSEGSYRSRTE